jgi:transcriptional regulator with XRE-family HTH domain
MRAIINNKKHVKFREMVSNNRSLLKGLGFSYSTVTRWASGERIPRLEDANKISVALNVPLSKIPYRTVVIT